jgi:3-dehydroquinate synthetase
MTRNHFAMTAELVGEHEWRICRGAATSIMDGPAWPAPLARLLGFADEVCSRTGAWAVRSVVFVAPRSGGPGATKIATYPRHVWMLTPSRALVFSLADDSQAVVVVDPATRSASVHMGDVERSMTDAEPHRVADVMRALDITRLLVRRATGTEELARQYHARCSSAGDVVDCWPESVRAGAERFAAGLVKDEGAWFTSGQTAVMRCRRDICYAIHHTRRGVFDRSDRTLADVMRDAPVLMVIDRNVEARHGRAIRAYSRKHLNVKATVAVDACELAKDLDQVEDICRAAADVALPRNGLIAGVGGGVTLDMAGLAAAIFRRGVGFVRVPTTLVGLVDVSVGIKQAVNAFGRKNILGTFFPPTASVNDYSLVRTSPARSISCGLAEILKIAVVRDHRLLQTVEQHGEDLLHSGFRSPAAVAASVARRAEMLMMEELASNLFETDFARLADFGHTFSSAIETASDYRIAHGEAVALDMVISTGIAVTKGLCGSGLLERLMTLFPRLDLPVWHEWMPDEEHLLRALEAVVAHRGGHLNLVVPRRAGAATFVQDVSARELTAALNWMRSGAELSPLARREHADCASAGF